MARWCSMATTSGSPTRRPASSQRQGSQSHDRRVVHERAARRLEQTDAPSPAVVADHWYEAGDDPGTLRWAQLAGEAAFGAGASAEASHHFERALLAAQRLHRPDAEIVGLAERLATAAHAARRAHLEAWALQAGGCGRGVTGAAARLMVRQATCARTSGRLRAASDPPRAGAARRTARRPDRPVRTPHRAGVDRWSGLTTGIAPSTWRRAPVVLRPQPTSRHCNSMPGR